jgi:hypothetical protein
MKSMGPVEPRLRKDPFGTSITTFRRVEQCLADEIALESRRS